MPKTLCLNMIVRNEMVNLERCLGAVAEHVACWVIGDTGSTDGTQDFITSFFALRGIPGELHNFPFHNFEQARNAALDCAIVSPLAYDYLLLADADMELVVEDRSFRQNLEATGYSLLQRNSGITYWNTRLLRRDAGARYHGVTHEYLGVPGGVQELHGAWYVDHATGSNRADKYSRDITLLEEALRTEADPHLRGRYTFYLAQTYRDAGGIEKALQYFMKRAELGGWAEETFMSLYAAGKIQETMRQPFDGVIGTYLRACAAVPTRAEAFHAASCFCRINGKYSDAYDYAHRGLMVALPMQGLFVETWIYDYALLDELATNAHQLGRHAECLDACDRLLREGKMSQQMHERIRNYRDLARSKLESQAGASGYPDMIDLVPRPVADVEVEVVDGEVLMYHPAQTRAVYLNPTAAVVWGLCDGKRSARDIIEMLGESYPDAGPTLSDDILETLRELEESGVLVIG